MNSKHQWLERFLNNTPDIVYFIDLEGRLQNWNSALQDFCGLSADEMKDRSCLEFVSDQDRPQVEADIQKVFSNGSHANTYRFIRSDGFLVPFYCNGILTYNEDGDPDGFAGVGRNISEFKLPDDAPVRIAEKEKYHAILQTATDGFWTVDKEGRLSEVNDSYCVMSGYSRDELLKMRISDLEANEVEEETRRHIEKIIATGRDQFETQHRRKDGSIIDVEITTQFMPLADQMFVVFVKDITRRKQFETEIIRLSSILEKRVEERTAQLTTEIAEREKSEQVLDQYAAIINSSDDAILGKTMDGVITSWNNGAVRMFGYTSSEAVGQHISLLIPQEYQHKEQSLMEQIRNGDFVSHYESIRQCKDGKQIDVSVTISPIIDKDGCITGLSTISRDITEKKQSKKLAHQFGNLLQSSFNEIFIFDADDFHFIQASDGAQRNLGYSFDELKKLTPLDIKPLFTLEKFEKLAMPLRNGEEQIVFFETVHQRKDGTTYPVEIRLQLLQDQEKLFLAIVQDITERKVAEDQIRHLAYFDSLTELPNRRLLLDRLNQGLASSSRSGMTGALLFIDLDNFKDLNDTLGHDMGDFLLKQVTHRLESHIRDGDTVARLGGDEFVIMLLDLGKQEIEAAAQTEEIGEKIIATLGQPYRLNNNIYRCTASIGITLFNGTHQTAEELMKQSDIAMYQAKKAGRNTLRFFDRQMQENISARVSLENELHNAIEFRQFHLHYQIQIDDSHRLLGTEALIRWIHPTRGLVSPAQFIPLAEETGLILPLGQWVLETACAQLRRWGRDPKMRELSLAINVSAKQLHQPDFFSQVQNTVQQYGINPNHLKLELTESMLQKNIEETIATMNSLHEIGVRLSLDDFGTGFSSLEYLKRLPLDQLKIDQSFVRDIGTDSSDAAVVRAVIALARSLEMDVIAEGVETEEQRRLLLQNGCTQFQGYLFGKPVPIEQLEVSLKEDTTQS